MFVTENDRPVVKRIESEDGPYNSAQERAAAASGTETLSSPVQLYE